MHTLENTITQLFEDWRFLPSDYTVQLEDYNAVADYFTGKRTWSQLKEDQRDMIQSLEYKAGMT